MKRDMKISYDNPVFIKYLLSGDDEDSENIRKSFIRYVTGHHVKETKVLNPEIDPESKDLLHTAMKDENGILYDFLIFKDLNRAALISIHVLMGQHLHQQLCQCDNDDSKIRPVHMIVFVSNDTGEEPGVLVHHYKYADDEGNFLTYDMNIHIINISAIDDVAKRKGMAHIQQHIQGIYH